MNLAFLKQVVLNFIIVSLDPPRLASQNVHKKREGSLPEVNAERFQSDCGWLGLPWPQTTFLFSCLMLCVSAQHVGELQPLQLGQVQLLSLPTLSQFLTGQTCFQQCLTFQN